MENEFREYLSNNNKGEVSSSTLWDAVKAVLRGKILMWSAPRKKERETDERSD